MRGRSYHELDLEVYIRRRKELLKRLQGNETLEKEEKQALSREAHHPAPGGVHDAALENRVRVLEDQVRRLTEQLVELSLLKNESIVKKREETTETQMQAPEVDAKSQRTVSVEEGSQAGLPETPRTSREPLKQKEAAKSRVVSKKDFSRSPSTFHMTEHEKTPLPLPGKGKGYTINMDRVDSREDVVITRKTPALKSKSVSRISSREIQEEEEQQAPPKQKKVLKKREPFDMKAKRLKSLKKQADWKAQWENNGSLQRKKSTKLVIHSEDI